METFITKMIRKIKKCAKNVKKAWRKLKYLDRSQLTYYIVTGFIGTFCVFTGGTYAAFTITTYSSVGNITIAKLSYNLEIEACTYGTNSTCTYNNNTSDAYPYVTVPANTTVSVDMSLTSLNNNNSNYTSRVFNTKYAINYSKVNTGITNFDSGDNVNVYYSQNYDNNMLGRIGPYGSEITPIRIVIANNSGTSKNVYLTTLGGYLQNSLTTNITTGYYENDLTIRTTILDYDFSLLSHSNTASFPVNDANNSYAYMKTVCSEAGANVTWDNDDWELTINSDSSVSCDVYFKKMCNGSGVCNDIEIIYNVKDEDGNESVSTTSPDDSYVYKGYTCNNDATLTTPTWNSTNHTWEFNISGVDGVTLCTAYFKVNNSLSDYIISQYGSDANLYYHTTDTTKYQNSEGSISSTEPTNSTTETYANLNANDGSYRYSGANPNNYVCFGTDSESTCLSDTSNNGTSKYLYRIIGVFDDGSGNKVTKIVMANPLYNSATSAETYRWDYGGSAYANEWTGASLKQWLNSETLKTGSESYYPTTKFLSNYTSTWTNKIVPSTWYVRGFTSNTLNAKSLYTDEIANVKNGVSGYTTNYQGNSAILTNTKLGLEYVSDYMYAASPTYWNYPGYSSSGASYDYRAASSTNWLLTGTVTWAISPRASGTNIAWHVNASGNVDGILGSVSNAGRVLPVMYLASNVEIDTSATSADGSSSHPYILKA